MTKNEFKTRLKYDLVVVNDWFVQHSNLYYRLQQKREYQASQRSLTEGDNS